MKKTLAESIRDALNVLNEANAGALNFALSDLHKESDGNPTKELADEIAADYPGLTGERIMAAYPEWAEKNADRVGNNPPQMDPKKAAQKADWDRRQLDMQRERERQEKQEADRAEKAAFREKHAELINSIKAEMETVQAPAGWTKEVTDSEYEQHHTVGDMTFTNDAGDIKIIMHVVFHDPERELHGRETRPSVPYEVNGDTTFQALGKWYTFTDYSKWGDSFHIGQYGEHNDFSSIPEVIAEQAEKAQAAIDRKTERGY